MPMCCRLAPKGRAFCVIDQRNIRILGEKVHFHMSFIQSKFSGSARVVVNSPMVAVKYPNLVEYLPDLADRQIKMSAAPVSLGLKHLIWSTSRGTNSSNLASFHFMSVVSRSDTLRSSPFSWTGQKKLIFFSRGSQESFHTLVSSLFPIALPTFPFSKSLPCSMLLHLCEHTAGACASKNDILWQYFQSSTRTSRQSGAIKILHACFANRV